MACILLVDDYSGIRKSMKTYFEDRDYEVLIAADGAEALEIFSKNQEKISIVVTDLEMPKMRGDELATHIKKSNQAMPIIIMTGKMPQNRTAADAVVDKINGVEAILAAIEKLLA